MGKPITARRRSASKLKGRRVPKGAAGQIPSAAGAEAQLARPTRELNDSLEREAATADVLRLIKRLCEAEIASLIRPENPKSAFIESVKIDSAHTMLGVPRLRDGVSAGVIVLSRRAVRPFSNKQIEPMQSAGSSRAISEVR